MASHEGREALFNGDLTAGRLVCGEWILEPGRIIFPNGDMHITAEWWAAHDAKVRAEAWDEGVRQAVEWLRADYEYGTGPQWREDGCEWITDCLTEHRIANADTIGGDQ